MKKLSTVISGIIMFLILISPVKADVIIDIQYGEQDSKSELWYLKNLEWDNWSSYIDENISGEECSDREDCYQKAIEYFSTLNYQYYSMYVSIHPQNNHIGLTIIPFNFEEGDLVTQYVYSSGSNINRYHFSIGDSNLGLDEIKGIVLDGYSDPYANNFYLYYDGNYNFINSGDYVFRGFYDNEGTENYDNMLKVENNGEIPKIKDLIQYNSWSDYENNHLEGYTEVNLDNYEYVLLSLKNYNQTDPFQTNLQVKGQIGITPIYNFGQTSKDAITGVQVQDRCNLSYENYTSYPFYIIQSDLQNNAIYAIKECSQGSSFKFDSSIFDITYVTSENEENPTITIDGKTYNVIPYDDLPSTATKNEEDNYIPGESGNATDTGGVDSAIKNVQKSLSEIWNTFSYFTDFVGQLFSSLPTEIRTVLLSAFVVGIVIGLIKLFVG